MQGETRLTFAAGHPAFAGHFPGQPIVPGALLLDAAVHAVQQTLAADGRGTATCQVSSAKFLSPVKPDEVLSLSWSGSGNGPVRFSIGAPGRQVATGLLVFGTLA